MISTSLPSASRQWVKSDCHSSLGAAASNRIHELRGRLRGSETTRPCRVEDAPDRRARRRHEPLTTQVPADRQWAGVEPLGRELGSQLDDPDAHRIGRPPGVGERTARAWLEGVEPAAAVSTQEPVQVPAAHLGFGRGGGDG
jgi:hypothetical protein